MEASATPRRAIGLGTLGVFFAIAFGVGWGLIALLILFPDQITATFGPMGYTNPLFIIAVYAPGIAGLFLVWRHYGLAGLGSYLRRLSLWRMPAVWWIYLVLGIPMIFYVGAAIKGTLGEPFPFSPWYTLLPALLTGLLIGPVEELGWRGFALPILQRRFAPLWASVILGVVWGLWHAPAFLLSGSPQSSWAFGPYFIGVVAVSIILTPMFNAARGSILIAALYHFQLNGPAWPDAQPWDMLAFAIAAVVVVVLNRHTMFTRAGAVTEVLMPSAAPLPSSAPIAAAS